MQAHPRSIFALSDGKRRYIILLFQRQYVRNKERQWQPASTENNASECHTCSDWNGCGTDCTLSRVFCAPCGTSLELGGVS